MASPTQAPEPAGPAPSGPIGPIATSERIEVLDLLRGFALFGILVVNMQAFSNPLPFMFHAESPWTGTADRVARIAIEWFAQGKFYTLFSFLFGFGFAMYLMRAEQRGESPTRIYRRRIGVLMLIGAVHAFLIWMGDILLTYALIAWPLMLFRKARPRTLLRWAVALLLIPAVLTAVFAGFIWLGKQDPKGRAEIEKAFAEQKAGFKREIDNSYRAYGSGDFMEITRQRARDVKQLYTFLPFYGSSVLGMFLLGLWAGRTGLFERVSERLDYFRRVQRWSLPIGLVGSAIGVWAFHTASPTEPSFIGALGAAVAAFGTPALSAFYGSTLILLWHHDAWRHRLQPMAAAGRMALSNYLLQSLICTTIFYSYGLGFYGRVGFAWGLLITVVIYAVQLPLSERWMERHAFGPAEWLWRLLTYGHAVPMRKAAAA